jgi:hypothetical protein
VRFQVLTAANLGCWSCLRKELGVIVRASYATRANEEGRLKILFSWRDTEVNGKHLERGQELILRNLGTHFLYCHFVTVYVFFVRTVHVFVCV